MKRQYAFAAGVVVLVFLMSGISVSAHHSRAGIYGANSTMITLKGVVSELRWRNPHVYLVFDVKDQTGKTVRWASELSAVTTMIAEGVNRDSFKPGEEVTVTLVPALNGGPQGLLLKVVTADGRIPIDRTNRGNVD